MIPYTKKSKEIFEDAKKQIEMGMTVELSSEGDGTEVEATGKSTDKELNSNTKGADDYDVPSVIIIPPNEILRKN